MSESSPTGSVTLFCKVGIASSVSDDALSGVSVLLTGAALSSGKYF